MTILRRAALLGCVTVLAASVARGQTQPPPATSPSPPAAAAPPAAATAPAPTTPPAPADPTAPISPLSPAMAPDPNAPPLVLTERTTPQPPAARPEPIYRKVWFWAALSVVVATVTVILVWNLGTDNPTAPSTTFGNMHAF
jgi:hypothetical protein